MIKTSTTDPIEIAFIPAAVLAAPGALGITIAPGKQGRSDLHRCEWRRDLHQDLARIRQAYGVQDVVSLLERHEQHQLGIHDYRRVAKRQGITLEKFPIRDVDVPGLDDLRQLARRLSAQVSEGRRVVVHCRGGLGRSGLVVAAVLVVRGMEPARAIEAVRAVRPGAIQTVAQERIVHDVAAPLVPGFGAWMGRLRLGRVQRFDSLDVYPVLLPNVTAKAPWLLAEQAIGRGLLSVAEIGDGTVGRVSARSKALKPILVLEGETFLGCKQNRVATRSALIAAGAAVQLEVGCMEHGRWDLASTKFGVGDVRMEAAVRQRTVGERTRGGFDQGRLWAQVDERLASSRLQSRTSDYHAFVANETGGRLRREPGATVSDQVGVLVLHGDRIVALEIVGSAPLWKRAAPRTVPALLLASEGRGPAPATVAPDRWLARIAGAPAEVSNGLGLGCDVVIQGSGFVGAGLWAGDEVAHLAVFGAA